jgi:probable F420-dependent oxidoreductase
LKAATGIASIAARTAMAMQAGWKALSEAYPGRFVLGMGVSHGHMVTKLHKSPYEKPYSTMVEYLDNMDSVPYFGVAPSGPLYRVLAALGPKMLELSRDRTSGAHPYFTTPEHTAEARSILGPDKLVAPEQMVIFETNADKARETARKNMSVYTRLPNYANNLIRLGFSADEIKEQSDRLVDEIVCWGTLDKIAARIKEHHDAGADHVCVQVLMHDGAALPMAEWRQLAELLK